MKTKILQILILSFSTSAAFAKTVVVTTTADLASVVKEVGGQEVEVESIAKGTQDPHFVEAKPSYMTKVARADLIVSIGLGLEAGWLPSILRGARNTKLTDRQHQLEVGPLCNPIEVANGAVTRADGDVHPEGNPHVTLDPMRIITIAHKVADRLGELDSAHKKQFADNADVIDARLKKAFTDWKARLQKTGIKKVITYHKTLNYFLNAFAIDNPIDLEPKPGIPPTSKHILNVIQTIKEQNIKLILVENFFDESQAQRIKQDTPEVRVVAVPVSVGGEQGIDRIDQLFEKLVSVFEGK